MVALVAGVVAVAGLQEEVLGAGLGEREDDAVVAVGGGLLVGGVAEAVLGAQLIADLLVDLGEGLFLADLEEASAGLVGHALEDLLAVDMAWETLRLTALAASASTPTGVATASTGKSTATAATASGESSAALAARILIESAGCLAALEVDGVDDGVGALGGLDGGGERLLAAAVHAVGEDDDGLASGLLAHQLVAGEEERVVEGGPGAARASGAVAGAPGAGIAGVGAGAGCVVVAAGGWCLQLLEASL